VQHFTMVVTPDGEWVSPDSPDCLAVLGDPNPDYDAVAFAVKNLGFVKFQVIQHSIVEIELHPRNVELPALLAAQQQLLSSEVRLFRIKYFDTSWKSEITSSAEATIARLSELCAPACSPALNERFLVEPQDFSSLFEGEPSQLRPMAQKWRISFGQFDPSVVSLAVRHQLLSRMVIVGVKPREREPRWRFIGDGHRWMGEYQVRGVGDRVENMPDKEYGGWVSEFYKSVASCGQPRYDLVTALLQYESENGKPRRPVRYERLLLPWKTPSDEVFITLCSKIVATDLELPADSIGSDSSLAMNSARSA